MICAFDGADKKVFPNFYILGWYSTGSEAQESDLQIHKAVSFALPLEMSNSFCELISLFMYHDTSYWCLSCSYCRYSCTRAYFLILQAFFIIDGPLFWNAPGGSEASMMLLMNLM